MTQVAKKQSTRKPKTEEQVLAEMTNPELGKPFDGDYVVAKVDLPMQDPEIGTFLERHSGRIDVRLDKGPQASNFRQVYAALKLNNYKLSSGKYVDSANDAIKWIFENIQA